MAHRRTTYPSTTGTQSADPSDPTSWPSAEILCLPLLGRHQRLYRMVWPRQFPSSLEPLSPIYAIYQHLLLGWVQDMTLGLDQSGIFFYNDMPQKRFVVNCSMFGSGSNICQSRPQIRLISCANVSLVSDSCLALDGLTCRCVKRPNISRLSPSELQHRLRTSKDRSSHIWPIDSDLKVILRIDPSNITQISQLSVRESWWLVGIVHQNIVWFDVCKINCQSKYHKHRGVR